ncbi:hypothetical protein SDC9_139108 [bioreactor metagenome]|uniref:Uncharacterized protein n=1 Tax=bioreactor metagenome TaxID=1076179 RepID=A0A645DR76_9ZZZZ
MPDLLGAVESGVGGQDARHRHHPHRDAQRSQVPGCPGGDLGTATPAEQGDRTTMLRRIAVADECRSDLIGDGQIEDRAVAPVGADEHLERIAQVDPERQRPQPVLLEFPACQRLPDAAEPAALGQGRVGHRVGVDLPDHPGSADAFGESFNQGDFDHRKLIWAADAEARQIDQIVPLFGGQGGRHRIVGLVARMPESLVERWPADRRLVHLAAPPPAQRFPGGDQPRDHQASHDDRDDLPDHRGSPIFADAIRSRPVSPGEPLTRQNTRSRSRIGERSMATSIASAASHAAAATASAAVLPTPKAGRSSCHSNSRCQTFTMRATPGPV